MKKVYPIILLLLVGVFVFSAWQVVKLSGEYAKSNESYASLEQYISIPDPTQPKAPEQMPGETTVGAVPTEPVAVETPAAQVSVDFEALRRINPDIVGWIYIEDTPISYPIVQGADNEYYLDRLFDGTYNQGGCIFLDANCRSDFSGEHSIIYGHHMKDGSMFAGIRDYRDQAYYDAHTEGLLLTPEGTYRVAFFSGYVASTLENAWQMSFSAEDYAQWLEEITKKSLFDAEISPTSTDRILTLSTCSYEFAEARFVLHGIILETV